MKTVAIVSQKGGSGKSTLALHLAAHHASRGSKTLLLDMDPRGNLVGWAKRRGDAPPDVDTAHASQLGKVLEAAREVERLYVDVMARLHGGAKEAA